MKSSRRVAVVGTSPILIIKALYEKKCGNEVTVFNKSADFGGAWVTRSAFGFKNIEVGCHYMSRSKKAYHFLETITGIQFIKANRSFLNLTRENLQSNKKISWINRLIIPHQLYKAHIKKPKLVLSILNKVIKVKPLRHIKNDVKELVNWRSLRYPRDGIAAINNALKEKLRQSDIKIIEQKIISTDVTETSATIITETNNYLFDKICMGQNVNIQISENDQILSIPKVHRKFIHITYLIEGIKLKDFSCIQKKGRGLYYNNKNNFILRIADVGKYCKEKDEKRLIICCQILPEVFEEDEVISKVFSSLKKLKLISANSAIIDHHIEKYESNWISKKDYSEITAKLPDSIEIVASEDLAYCIERYYDQWKLIIEN